MPTIESMLKPTKHRLQVTGDDPNTSVAVMVTETPDEPGYAIGHLTIFGSHFHVEAVEVEESKEKGKEGWQVARMAQARPINESRLEDWQQSHDGLAFTETRFDNRQWVILITPHIT